MDDEPKFKQAVQGVINTKTDLLTVYKQNQIPKDDYKAIARACTHMVRCSTRGG